MSSLTRFATGALGRVDNADKSFMAYESYELRAVNWELGASRLALRCALIWHLFLPAAELPAGQGSLCGCLSRCLSRCRVAVCPCAAPLSYTMPFSVLHEL